MKALLVLVFLVVACAAKEQAPDPVFLEKVPRAEVPPSEDVGPEPTPTPQLVKKTFKTKTHDKLLKKKKKKKHLDPNGV